MEVLCSRRFVTSKKESDRVGAPPPTVSEIGNYATEAAAVKAARKSMADFFQSGRPEYAWWIVRRDDAQLANWIADSRTRREFMVDLTTSKLVEVAWPATLGAFGEEDATRGGGSV